MTIKIFLGNLNSDTTSDQLRPLFEKYGEVVECDVLKNFGFVHMNNKADANKAIAQLDGYSIDGNNIRVELSTGKKGGGGGGKFDRKGFGPAGRGRPYGPPPGRDFRGPPGGGRGGDRFFPPPPPMPFPDRYDPYYRYCMEREAYYARMGGPMGRDRMDGPPPGDRFPPPDRMGDRFSDPRDRLPPARSFMEDRNPRGADPYFRDRDPLGSRPPPEYYERKMGMGAGGRGADSAGAAGAAAGRGGSFNGMGNGGGDYYARPGMDRPSMGGAAGDFGIGFKPF